MFGKIHLLHVVPAARESGQHALHVGWGLECTLWLQRRQARSKAYFTRPMHEFSCIGSPELTSKNFRPARVPRRSSHWPWRLACTYLPPGHLMLRLAGCGTVSCAHTVSRCAKRLHSTRSRPSGSQQAAAPPAVSSKTQQGLLDAAKAPAARGMAAPAAPGSSEAAAAAADPGSTSSGAAPPDPLLQYVVLRRDLWKELDWPLGSVVAQGCHAATAALWGSRESATTQEYCAPENIDHMHKVRSTL